MFQKWNHWDLENGEFEAWGLSADTIARVLPPVLPHLVTLNFTYCDVASLPSCLRQAPFLLNLFVQGCGLENVPDWLPELGLNTCILEPDRLLPARGHYQKHCGRYWDQATLMSVARDVSSPGDSIGENALRIVAALTEAGTRAGEFTNGVQVVSERSCLRFRLPQRLRMNTAVFSW